MKRIICKITQKHYRRVSAPEQWESMLKDKYGIPQSKCSKKHKKGVCWLFAESETEFDKQGNVCKSSRKVYNTQLQTGFCYHNVYDVHCRLVQWEMSMQQNGATVQFPQSVLLQPTKMVFSYNEHGDLASASDGNAESTLEYKYGKNDNWITRYQIVNEKCVEIIDRQLKYGEAVETVAESDLKKETDEETEEMTDEEVVVEEEMEEEEIQEVEEYEGEEVEEPEEDDLEEPSEEEPSESAESIIGQKVIHGKFGIGEIQSIEEKDDKQYISVAFDGETKRFIYPDAFERFLKWYEE